MDGNCSLSNQPTERQHGSTGNTNPWIWWPRLFEVLKTCCNYKCIYTNTHTHTCMYVYIYIYMCFSACSWNMFLCESCELSQKLEGLRDQKSETSFWMMSKPHFSTFVLWKFAATAVLNPTTLQPITFSHCSSATSGSATSLCTSGAGDGRIVSYEFLWTYDSLCNYLCIHVGKCVRCTHVSSHFWVRGHCSCDRSLNRWPQG